MKRDTPTFNIYPNRSRLRTKEQPFSIIAEAGEAQVLPEELTLSVYSLEQQLMSLEVKVPPNRSFFEIPLSFSDIDIRTSGLGLELTDGKATAATALDIGEGPVRYGFVSDFTPEESRRTDSVIKNFLKNHITHVQFYDWSYHPDQFGPDAAGTVYHDTMGKKIDLSLVKGLISSFQEHGIQSLAYGAVYAATKEYTFQHAEQALYDAQGDTFDLIGKFFIMNLLNRDWRRQILAQYRYALEEVGFDGIHMDTYGYPKTGWGYDESQPHSLEKSFVDFINEWGELGGENIFNNVGGWPALSTVKANQAACYIEVWDPHIRYRHLRKLINEVNLYGKPVILAAYLLPFKERDEKTLCAGREPLAAAQLLTAAVTTFGATSLLLGEEGAVLTQPYYSDYSFLAPSEAEGLRKYYDFQVRYRDLFYDTALADITESHLSGETGEFLITAEEYPVSWEGEAGTLWVTVRKSETTLVISLINLTNQADEFGHHDDLWNSGKKPFDTPVPVTLQIPRYWRNMELFTASPEKPRAEKLDASLVSGLRGPAMEVRVVMTGFWQTVFTG